MNSLFLKIAVAVVLSGFVPKNQQQIPDAFRIREIAIEGASLFSSDQVIAISGLNRNSIASPEMFELVRTRILRAYADRGCMKAQVSISCRYNSLPEEPMLVASVVR